MNMHHYAQWKQHTLTATVDFTAGNTSANALIAELVFSLIF